MRYLPIAAALCALPVPALALDTSLRCEGVVAQAVHSETFADVTDDRGRNASGSATTYTLRDVPDRFRIEMNDGDIRMQLPRSMKPPLSGGGDNGWWHLENAQISDTEINGHISLNFINKPRVRLDRINGDLTIDGLGKTGFRGTCVVEKRDLDQRKF